jgi:lipopolysaccharide export system protein LptA
MLIIIVSLLVIGTPATDAQVAGRRPALINILNADDALGPYPGMPSDLMRLLGNVLLSHEDILMSCDSAHRYVNSNVIHAFSNVHINKADTLNLTGDHLIYDGNTRHARVRRNVRLTDRESTLTTDVLDYDLANDLGYYPSRGVVINGDNRLESVEGYYYSRDKMFFFKDSVIVTNPDYIIRSDTLRYNTVTEVAYFLGPTTIIGDEINIYCENGWYNTQTDISQFNENARIRNNNQVLEADSIYYDNGLGTGRAFLNVAMTDSVERIIIKGDYAWFVREPEQTLVTDRALLIQMSDNDTLYMHADTLRSWLQISNRFDESVANGSSAPDTLATETAPDFDASEPASLTDTIPSGLEAGYAANDTVRIMTGYYGVRFFSNEMQGKCDSIYFNMRDSIVFMFGEPVIWSDENQLSAEFMEIHSKDGAVDHIVMKNTALVVSEEAPGFYNQIQGKEILGYVREGELFRVNVDGNAETLYYPEDNGEIIGMNKAASASLVIFLKENKPDRIKFLKNIDSILYPMEDLPEAERLLENFQWLDEIRPISREDVFRK